MSFVAEFRDILTSPPGNNPLKPWKIASFQSLVEARLKYPR